MAGRSPLKQRVVCAARLRDGSACGIVVPAGLGLCAWHALLEAAEEFDWKVSKVRAYRAERADRELVADSALGLLEKLKTEAGR